MHPSLSIATPCREVGREMDGIAINSNLTLSVQRLAQCVRGSLCPQIFSLNKSSAALEPTCTLYRGAGEGKVVQKSPWASCSSQSEGGVPRQPLLLRPRLLSLVYLVSSYCSQRSTATAPLLSLPPAVLGPLCGAMHGHGRCAGNGGERAP